FSIHHIYDTEKYLTNSGADVIQFLFSANKGSAPQDIKKVASGGELSRLMLCLKSLLAKSTALPTLIFDEIDSGVSGETAHKVGNILHRLANQHQVISITHLPQIASKGQHHLYVYKVAGKASTHTHIKLLSREERLTEIAKMLSGDKPTASALSNARELLEV
ncbi:MAG: DNA repair protein RecN, partial [Chitinophagales bacterium]